MATAQTGHGSRSPVSVLKEVPGLLLLIMLWRLTGLTMRSFCHFQVWHGVAATVQRKGFEPPTQSAMESVFVVVSLWRKKRLSSVVEGWFDPSKHSRDPSRLQNQHSPEKHLMFFPFRVSGSNPDQIAQFRWIDYWDEVCAYSRTS